MLESARGAVLRMVGMISQIKGETCIVQFVDDMTLINVLLYQGLYVYSEETGCRGSGTVDFSVEIARSVSNILQFAQAQNIPEKVKMVYIAGLEKRICRSMRTAYARLTARFRQNAEVWE